MTHDPMDTQILVRPEVTDFVEQVRRLLADLDDETRDELIGGLEADLSDQVADGAELGDPAAYAAELRAAAGLPERQRRMPRLRRPGSVKAVLDDSRARFLAFVQRPRVATAWEVVGALRPAWWVARAWAVALVADRITGPWEPNSIVPSLGHPAITLPVLAIAVLASTLIGMGRLWPGSGPDRRALPRVALAVGNVAAVVALLVGTVDLGYSSADRARDDGYGNGYTDGVRSERNGPGLRLDGEPINNVYAYAANGEPIPRVQLVDQDGSPITIAPRHTVTGRGADRSVGCPAFNGGVAVYNVFPLDQLALRRRTCDAAENPETTRPEHPLAELPEVTTSDPVEGKVERTRPPQG